VEYFSVGECLDNLRLCPGLRSAIFEQVRVSPGQIPFSAQPIHHENLEVLELSLSDTTWQLPSIIGTMTLPSLKELVLSLPDDEPFIQTIPPLVRRSGCQLRHLHYVGITPPENELIECLKEMTMLEVLLLLNPLADPGGLLTQRFLEFLNPRGGGKEEWVFDGCLLPRLEKFVYQGSIGFSSHSLIRCLVNRWRGGGPLSLAKDASMLVGENPFGPSRDEAVIVSQLRSVEFTTPKKIKFDGADTKVLQGLIREGMQLDFLVDPNSDGP